MNWKENFFNVTTKNKWDIGWPTSPRLMAMMIAVIYLIIIFLMQT